MTVEQRNAIVLAHLDMADRLAWRWFYRLPWLRWSVDDWKQEARLALVRAVPECYRARADDDERRGVLWRGMSQRFTAHTLRPLFRSAHTHGGVARAAQPMRTVSLRPGHQPTVNEVALLEAAIDVATLAADAHPVEQQMLRVTLADQVVNRCERAAKHRFVARMRQKVQQVA